MKESAADVILHPVRMRIIQLLVNQELTAQQLKEILDDIPQASLYRNIKKLVEAEVIHVVNEIPIRGTVEKVYSIHNPKAVLGPEELQKLSKDEHMSLFMKFFANLISEYDRYLSGEKINFQADGLTFRQASIYLSDDEFNDFLSELVSVYSKVFHNKPEKGRTRRTIGTIIIPGDSKEK
jgi:DNA-binding transcriptional ArsR family regulator